MAQNSPSMLGGAESEDEEDEWEGCVPAQPVVVSDDVPILPMESSPSLRSAAPAVAPEPLLLPPRVEPKQEEERIVSFQEMYEHQNEPVKYEAPPVPPGTRVVRIKDKVVQFKKAPMKRASRAAKASEPSVISRRVCQQLIATREGELKRVGRTKLGADDNIKYRAGSASGGRGPAVRAQVEHEQARMNHIAALKARNVETYNNEASFLLWGNTSEQCYDKLAESALRANAGNSSVTKRRDTQGAAYQSKQPPQHPHHPQHPSSHLILTYPCALQQRG